MKQFISKTQLFISTLVITNLSFYSSCTNESNLSSILVKNHESCDAKLTVYDWEIINRAKQNALKAIERAIDLENPSFDKLVIKHFNLRSSEYRSKHFRQKIIRIKQQLKLLNEEHFLKSNTKLIAYVYPDDEKKIIWLGHLFFQLRNNGMESKASVLIHEVSHWSDCLATNDYAYYGEKLALLSCSSKINNANSWENFIIEASEWK